MWHVAPSYKNMEITKVDEENKKALVKGTCDKCGGLGIIVSRVENGHPIPIPVDNGVCYKCNGVGQISKWVKAYTDEEYEKYLKAQERAKERKAEKWQAEQEALLNQSEENKRLRLESFGYDPVEPIVYIVYGENTYAIKDELKGAGARFNPALGWYFTKKVEIPEGYILVEIPFDNVFDWVPTSKRIEIKDGAKKVVEEALKPYAPKSNSEYIGEIKERIRDMKVTVTSVRNIDGFYGTSTIYTFKEKDNVLVWITSSYQDVEIGESVLLTGTVKDHSEYKGIKQTKMSRCIIKREAC